MNETAQTTSTANTPAENSNASGEAFRLTPELLAQITEKVYALMRRDLQLEQERARHTRPQAHWRF